MRKKNLETHCIHSSSRMLPAQILAMKCVSEEEEEVTAGQGDGRGWCFSVKLRGGRFEKVPQGRRRRRCTRFQMNL